MQPWGWILYGALTTVPVGSWLVWVIMRRAPTHSSFEE
jgi:hypothetical protein